MVAVLQLVPPVQSHRHRARREVQEVPDRRVSVAVEYRRDGAHDLVLQYVPGFRPSLEYRWDDSSTTRTPESWIHPTPPETQ